MNLNEFYHQNKPLFYSILTGIFYFFLHWSMDFGAASEGFLVTMMIFMPAITFPLTTSYFKSRNLNNVILKHIIHFVLSIGIYLIVSFLIYLDTQNAIITYSSIFAGFLGSFLFLLLTKYLLKKQLTLLQIARTSVLSGLALIPYSFIGKDGIFLGIGVFLWTVINGQLLNSEYKKAAAL